MIGRDEIRSVGPHRGRRSDPPRHEAAVTVVLLVRADAPRVRAVIDELARARAELPGLALLVVDRCPNGAGGAAIAELATARGLRCEVFRMPDTEARPDRSPERWSEVWQGVRLAATRSSDSDTSSPDHIVTIDPDGHHDPRLIPTLIDTAVREGYGVTIGSRWVRGGSAPATPLPRRMMSRLVGRLIGSWTGVPRIHDPTSSFRALRGDLVAAVGDGHWVARSAYASYAEFIAIARALGFAIGEVPIEFRPRHSPVRPLTIADLASATIDLARVRRRLRRIRRQMRADQTDWSTRHPGAQHQHEAMSDEFGAVHELMELRGADRFTNWIVEQFDGHLGTEVLEVGAGLGAISRCIAARHPAAVVTALEPAPNLHGELSAAVADEPRIRARPVTSQDWLARSVQHRYDAVVYVNVLEHIRDDVAELRTARELLHADGRLCIFVPALPRLYGSLDQRSGHYRRYTRRRLATVVGSAGFEIDRIHYLDPFGVFPYWLLYRTLGVARLGAGTSTLYDRGLVHIARVLQRLFGPPPIGKNLVVIARPVRPAESPTSDTVGFGDHGLGTSGSDDPDPADLDITASES